MLELNISARSLQFCVYNILGESAIRATREIKGGNLNRRVAGDKFRGVDGGGAVDCKTSAFKKSLALRRLITQRFKIAQ